jgi:hypothetical protein
MKCGLKARELATTRMIETIAVHLPIVGSAAGSK